MELFQPPAAGPSSTSQKSGKQQDGSEQKNEVGPGWQQGSDPGGVTTSSLKSDQGGSQPALLGLAPHLSEPPLPHL